MRKRVISVRVNGTMKEAESKRAVGDLYNEEDIDGQNVCLSFLLWTNTGWVAAG